MDNSLERDQLNLWQELNRLYGDEEAGEQSGDTPDEAAEAGPDEPVEGKEVEGKLDFPAAEEHEDQGSLGSAALEEMDLPEPRPSEAEDGQSAVNEVCIDCRYHCRQPAGQFVIARCRLAAQSTPHRAGQTPNRMATSQGSMGIENINEDCRRCSRSCKQRTAKLNRMLCLGHLPLDS